MNDDSKLTRRMLAGQESAFEEFFGRHFPGLFRFAASRLRNDDDAEEVAQATLVAAMRKLATYRGEASLFTWLCTFCRHEISALAARRGRTPAEPLEDAPELRAVLESLESGAEADPERQLLRKEVGRLVHVTLDHLPPHYASALRWKYLEGQSVEEIARRLELGPKAAESVLTRARQAFRDAFASMSTGLRPEGSVTR